MFVFLMERAKKAWSVRERVDCVRVGERRVRERERERREMDFLVGSMRLSLL